MWPQEFIWFFAIFHQEFRKGNLIAFEVLMTLAFAHFFGFYNPKQLADFLGIPPQKFYAELKDWSVYHVKTMLLRFMVKQAVEHLKPVLNKSAATQSSSVANPSLPRIILPLSHPEDCLSRPPCCTSYSNRLTDACSRTCASSVLWRWFSSVSSSATPA